MRTLLIMPAAEILLAAAVVALIVALLVFSRRFHSLSDRLEAQLNTDRDQQDRLERMIQGLESGAAVVATNLASSIQRADAADDSVPGSSADAALRTGDDE